MFQRDDQHHQRQHQGEEPFAGELAQLEPVLSCQVAQSLVKSRNARDRIQQTGDDKADSQPVQEGAGRGQIGLCRSWGRFVRHVVLLPRNQRSFFNVSKKKCPGRCLTTARHYSGQAFLTAWRSQERCSRPLPRRAPHRGGISEASRRTCRWWRCRQFRRATPAAGTGFWP